MLAQLTIVPMLTIVYLLHSVSVEMGLSPQNQQSLKKCQTKMGHNVMALSVNLYLPTHSCADSLLFKNDMSDEPISGSRGARTPPPPALKGPVSFVLTYKFYEILDPSLDSTNAYYS